MKMSPELIYRIGLSFFLVFVVGKVIGALLANWNANRKEKTRNVDIDLMIENKKSMLRATSGLNKSEESATNRKAKSKTEEEYKKAALKDSSRAKSYLEVLKLIEDLQWGDGKAFGDIQSYLESQWDQSVDTIKIGNLFNGFLVRDSFLALESSPLPDKNQIIQVLKVRLLCEQLLDDSRSATIHHSMAKKLNCEEWTARKASELALASALISSNEKLFATVLSPKGLKGTTPGKKQELFNANLMTADSKHFLTVEMLFSRIKKYAELIAPLRPLPSLKGKSDVDGAFKVMGLSPKASTDEIKSSYKKLASQLHPDRISGLKLGNEIEKVANENFATLQQAYDILKKQA
jgi:hypothetical protein